MGIQGSHEKVDPVKIVNSGLNSLVGFGRETLPQFSLEAIRSSTRVNAKLLGLNGGGLLTLGAPATFVVVKGPPENIPQSLVNIKCLYIDGIKCRIKIRHLFTWHG